MAWIGRGPCSGVPGRGLCSGRAVKHGKCRTCYAVLEAARDKARGSSTARGYGGAWPDIRRRFLARQPWCEGHGRPCLATEVDHRDGDPSNNTPANLRGFCKSAHSSRTAKDQAFGRKGGARG